MPRTKISEYSTTNSDNTDIEGINIAENCPPSGINNAIREVMVHLKEFQTGASGDPLTVAGAFVASSTASLNGTTIPASATLVKTSDKLSVMSATSSSELAGVISDETGTGALVFANSPTLVTPTLGAASATSVTVGAGTVSAPSITTTGDTNTGIYFPAADTIAFAEGGVEAMRIDSSGNVGIGVNSLAGKFHVSGGRSFLIGGNENYSVAIGRESNTNAYYLGVHSTSSPDLLFSNNAGTETMRLTYSGNVGIGTSSPTARLGVSGAIALDGTSSSGPSNGGIARLSNGYTYFVGKSDGNGTILTNGSGTATVRIESPSGSTGYIAFESGNGSERMRIDSAGNLGLGVTPSAWSAGKAIEINNVGNCIQSGSSATISFGQNTYLNSGWRYANTGVAACRFDISSGAYVWNTAPSGTAGNAITFTQALTLDANRNLLLNGTSAGASAVGTLAIFNGTAPTGSVTNGIILYAEDVSSSSELKVRDEAGNVTTLSPHNFSMIPEGPSEEMAWAYYSEKNGKKINVDMLKLARMVEKLTGEKLVYEA